MESQSAENCEADQSQIINDFVATKSLIEKALNAEHTSDTNEALLQYQQAIATLQKTLGRRINARCQNEKTKTLAMMKQALECCRTRVAILDQDVVDYAKYILNTETLHSNIENETKVVFEIPGGVQLFGVLTSDEIIALSGNPTSLQVMLTRMTNDGLGPVTTLCTIKVGSWAYLLDPEAVVVKRETNIYEFPMHENEHVPERCTKFGIVISSDLHPQYEINFENILEDACDFTIEEGSRRTVINLSKTVGYHGTEDNDIEDETVKESGKQQRSEKDIGNSTDTYDDVQSGKSRKSTLQNTHDVFTAGTDVVCDGIAFTARLTSSLIHRSSKNLQKIIPVASQPAEVNGHVEKACEIIYIASDKGVMLTDGVVEVYSQLADAAAKKIAPIVTSLAGSTTSVVESIPGQRLVKDVLSVTKSGVSGLNRIWTELEEANLEIQKAASDATVDTIHHRYGANAANIATHVTETVMNAGKVRANYRRMNIKKLAKQFAHDTGTDFLETYINEPQLSTISVNI